MIATWAPIASNQLSCRIRPIMDQPRFEFPMHKPSIIGGWLPWMSSLVAGHHQGIQWSRPEVLDLSAHALDPELPSPSPMADGLRLALPIPKSARHQRCRELTAQPLQTATENQRNGVIVVRLIDQCPATIASTRLRQPPNALADALFDPVACCSGREAFQPVVGVLKRHQARQTDSNITRTMRSMLFH